MCKLVKKNKSDIYIIPVGNVNKMFNNWRLNRICVATVRRLFTFTCLSSNPPSPPTLSAGIRHQLPHHQQMTSKMRCVRSTLPLFL